MRKKKSALRKKLKTFLLLYFMFFTLYFAANTSAKYVGKISRDGATISIAKWEVSYDTSDNDSDTLNLVSGNITQNYILKVISTSEVATNYSIILSDLPSEIEVKLDNGVYQSPINNAITFNNVGSFDANDLNTEHIHTLTFNAPLESNISRTSEINIDINFLQINP